ncbi:MAG: hypothetical protein HZA35_04140 [Parcubacteria group bacterium]|nr:hypothetical protein [Parcubacteria group bacterium]
MKQFSIETNIQIGGVIGLIFCVLVFVFFSTFCPKVAVYADEGNRDTLYGVYSAVKIGMVVNDVRGIVKRLSPQDLKEIPESLEPSGDSTSGTFEARMIHHGNKDNDFTDTYLTLLFTSEGYTTSLLLVSARWEKRMRNGSSLEYSKKKGG